MFVDHAVVTLLDLLVEGFDHFFLGSLSLEMVCDVLAIELFLLL
jgi:hypothetical protein